MIEKSIQFDKTKKNKTYANSTISEALCEIHFSSNEEYDQKKIDELKKKLKKVYPVVSKEPFRHYHAAIGENGLSVKEEISQRSIFKHKERNHLLQIFLG